MQRLWHLQTTSSSRWNTGRRNVAMAARPCLLLRRGYRIPTFQWSNTKGYYWVVSSIPSCSYTWQGSCCWCRAERHTSVGQSPYHCCLHSLWQTTVCLQQIYADSKRHCLREVCCRRNLVCLWKSPFHWSTISLGCSAISNMWVACWDNLLWVQEVQQYLLFLLQSWLSCESGPATTVSDRIPDQFKVWSRWKSSPYSWTAQATT
jgi:hypothetical protein